MADCSIMAEKRRP